MSTLAEKPAVAKIKPKDGGSPPQSVKLPADVVESARIVAAYRNQAIADLIAGIVRPILLKMEREETAKRAKRGAE